MDRYEIACSVIIAMFLVGLGRVHSAGVERERIHQRDLAIVSTPYAGAPLSDVQTIKRLNDLNKRVLALEEK